MSNKYKVGDTLEVFVEKIVPNGLGMCFAENLTLFVPQSAKGDRLTVELRQIKGKTAFAQIIDLIEGSPARTEPKCEYFGTCGGCDFQHISYQAQLEAKVDMIRDCLTRIGRIEFDGEIPILKSPEEYGYRLRSQWHLDTRKKQIGYFKRQSHEIIDARSCPILVPDLEAELNALRENIPWEEFSAEALHIEAATDGKGTVSIYSDELVTPTDELKIPVGGDTFAFNAQTFFQSNKYLIEQLVGEAVGGAEGKSALDLYCGVGLFSIPLAKKFESLIGVEGTERSIVFARKNLEIARLDNVKFRSLRVSQFLKDSVSQGKTFDLVLLDPPRSGVKQGVLNLLAEVASKRITYVSCNPSTLARDLRILIDSGFKIDKVTAVDLFPQTHHIETVVHLSR
ncbi:MAG: class I SAM-dependent RNA methyltransferase [Acidobacteria bacterium]|nr:class I SAM-dependent RNA methyltransferase [Acidobacteriota bacterium]